MDSAAMRLVGRLLFVALLAGGTPRPTVAAGVDGIWTLRERFCVSLNRKKQCGPGREALMFLQGNAYYRLLPTDDWTEFGTVATSGHKITVVVNRSGIGKLVEHLIGFDVTDLLQNFAFRYSGRLMGTRISNGQVKANVDVDGGDVTYAIRIRGTFSGRRTGDAVAVPVPEPDPSPEIAVESATNDAAASTPGSRGAVPAVADAMRVVTAAH